jgi:tRNA-specific 2-thiouridylase
VVTSHGDKVGTHDGLPFYTIGQRHWGARNVETETGNEHRPLFIVEKRRKTNEIVVGYEDDPLLYKKETHIRDVHWMSGQRPQFPLHCEVRLRHRQPLQESRIQKIGSRVVVEFKKPQRAVTPGQFAVFYKNGECLGGGVID